MLHRREPAPAGRASVPFVGLPGTGPGPVPFFRRRLSAHSLLTIMGGHMNTGKLVRLNRIFGHSSGRLCSVAVDHFMGYQEGLPAGLRDIPAALKLIMKGRPDAITMQVGMARTAWKEFAGSVPLIIQSSMLRIDDTAQAQAATPEDAVRLGADGFAIACLVRGPTEWQYMQVVADAVRE